MQQSNFEQCEYDLVIISRFAEPWFNQGNVAELIEESLKEVEEKHNAAVSFFEVLDNAITITVKLPAKYSPNEFLGRVKRLASKNIMERCTLDKLRGDIRKDYFAKQCMIKTVGSVIKQNDIDSFIETSIESRTNYNSRHYKTYKAKLKQKEDQAEK